MNKYLVIQEIAYESSRTFTVFADTPKEAIELVEKDYRRIGDRFDSTTKLLKHDIKGTKVKGVIRASSEKHFY